VINIPDSLMIISQVTLWRHVGEIQWSILKLYYSKYILYLITPQTQIT